VREDRIASWTRALVASHRSDAPTELQDAIRVVKKHVSGRLGAESTRELAVLICHSVNAWNGCRQFPESGFLPFRLCTIRKKEKNPRIHVTVNKQSRKFVEAGPGAWTLRVCQHH